MLDQLIIENNRSYDDFEASVKERKIIDGKKKTIKESVPFSNVTYDFSKIDGELYWEEKSLEYTLEITANDPEELSQKIQVFKSWIMNVFEERLYDPYILDYHFIATFEDISVDETEVEKATISVTFTAYPYMISNIPKVYSYELTAGVEQTVTVNNPSSHRITPTFNASVPFTVKVGTESYAVSSGETTDGYFNLEAGDNILTLKSTENGSLEITFYEEVF